MRSWHCHDGQSDGAAAEDSSDFRFDVQHLAATIHAGLHVDMMGPVALACLLVFHVRWSAQGIMRTALIALHARYFFPGNGHGLNSFAGRLIRNACRGLCWPSMPFGTDQACETNSTGKPAEKADAPVQLLELIIALTANDQPLSVSSVSAE
jgi:hypothetical protein